MKIMIIDDNPISTFLMEEGIPKNNDILNLSSSNNVINSIKLFKPDLVLLDLIMPNISGFDVLKNIKKYDKNIKVIIVSSLDSNESVEKCKKLGCDYFIKKPINFNEFKNFMKKRLEYVN